jgi:hypothetical protein
MSNAKTIGSAKMDASGVLTLILRAEGPGALRGDARLMMTLEKAKARGFRFSSEPLPGVAVQVLAADEGDDTADDTLQAYFPPATRVKQRAK